MWTLMLLTLPTEPKAVRQRLWRALKALGSASLRDGCYLLPSAHAQGFSALADEAERHGGSATILDVTPRAAGQQDAWLALFDRRDDHARWLADAGALHAEMEQLGEPHARRRLRSLDEALQALTRIDFFPGPGAAESAAALTSLRESVERRLSPGEPSAGAESAIERLDRSDFQGRRWATRRHLWVDRMACAWLIRRFVDPQARFVWLNDPARPPRGVIGFDYDGARFSHVGDRVSFEVLALSFGLDADAALRRIGQVVHALDLGGPPVPEAAGLERVLGGLRLLHGNDDDALLAAVTPVFDALLAATEAA